MSAETMEWLNRFTLIGFTEKRGKAWHWRQGSDNHFEGAVPVETVRERLFNWSPVMVTPSYPWQRPAPVDGCLPCMAMECGEHVETVMMEAPGQGFVIRSDTGALLGAHTSSFSIHGYDDWLIKNAEAILGQGLHIGQAGLLKNGAQAWVSFEMPDTVSYKAKGARGPEVEFRPQLMATTSLDGSVPTTYKLVYTIVVCDNTRTMALKEDTPQFKIKHTKHSSLRIANAREALEIVFKMTDDFKAELDTLMRTSVNARQWDAFKELYVPIDPESKRGTTMAERKRDELNELYERDDMVAPWNGTAYGVIQAVNTWQHHNAIVRKVGRIERNTENVIKSKIDDLDSGTMATLNKVLQAV